MLLQLLYIITNKHAIAVFVVVGRRIGRCVASAIDAPAAAAVGSRLCAARYILKRFILSSLIKPLLRKAYVYYAYTDSKAARENEIFYVY